MIIIGAVSIVVLGMRLNFLGIPGILEGLVPSILMAAWMNKLILKIDNFDSRSGSVIVIDPARERRVPAVVADAAREGRRQKGSLSTRRLLSAKVTEACWMIVSLAESSMERTRSGSPWRIGEPVSDRIIGSLVLSLLARRVLSLLARERSSLGL